MCLKNLCHEEETFTNFILGDDLERKMEEDADLIFVLIRKVLIR